MMMMMIMLILYITNNNDNNNTYKIFLEKWALEAVVEQITVKIFKNQKHKSNR
jgi:YbbR domain-containing protein